MVETTAEQLPQLFKYPIVAFIPFHSSIFRSSMKSKIITLLLNLHWIHQTKTEQIWLCVPLRLQTFSFVETWLPALPAFGRPPSGLWCFLFYCVGWEGRVVSSRMMYHETTLRWEPTAIILELINNLYSSLFHACEVLCFDPCQTGFIWGSICQQCNSTGSWNPPNGRPRTQQFYIWPVSWWMLMACKSCYWPSSTGTIFLS